MRSDLCARYGFCEPGIADTLSYTANRDEIVEAILVAEGLNPLSADSHMRRYLADAVYDWLFDPNGRGVRSGLPR